MAANKSRFMFDSPCAGRLIQLISASVLVFTGNLPTARATKKGGKTKLRRPAVDMTSPKDFPWIVEAALKDRQKRFVLDGEAMILDVDGISDLNAPNSGKHNHEVQLLAFDVLAMDSDDLRDLPLSMRKHNLARLLRG
jgi:ATP-dependent DNA ligase